MRLRCHFLLFPKYHTRWLVSGLKLDKSHQSSGFQHAVWHKVKLRGLQVFIVPREGKVQRAFNCSHTEYIYLLTVIKCDMRKNADTSEVGLFLGFSAFFGELPRSFSVHICVWIICERLFWILCFVWGKGNIFNVSTRHCQCFFFSLSARHHTQPFPHPAYHFLPNMQTPEEATARTNYWLPLDY